MNTVSKLAATACSPRPGVGSRREKKVRRGSVRRIGLSPWGLYWISTKSPVVGNASPPPLKYTPAFSRPYPSPWSHTSSYRSLCTAVTRAGVPPDSPAAIAGDQP